jgi:signal transduction histidine kinase
VVCWAAPVLVWTLFRAVPGSEALPLIVVGGVMIVVALTATRIKARYHRGSQAFRLVMLTSAVIVPALVLYPDVFQVAWRAKQELVETRYATQASNQRSTVKTALQDSLAQVDGLTTLTSAVATLASALPPAGTVDTDLAFNVWRNTALAAPLTSAIELYGPRGALVSRFAFNLPEDLSAVHRREEPSCDWDVYEEVSPFFAEQRRMLHAGRALCANGRTFGSIVVHAILDYADLPFIAARSPYIAMLRRDDGAPTEGASGRDIEYVVYGWSRTPLYASKEPAWPLSDAAFAQAMSSRASFWTELTRGPDRFDAFIMNDRGGIQALGIPVVSAIDHLVNVAEITALTWVTVVLLLGLGLLFSLITRRGATARALFREIRASFYRKLFLAFIASAVIPVLALALVTRAYMASQMRQAIESEAVRTASSARRVVEDLIVPRAEQQGDAVDDNLMVWVGRLIGEDVNVFSGPRLIATSERNLFASGLLPTRTPPDIYRDLALRMQASTVAQERVGGLEYQVVGTPLTVAGRRAMLTVPLTLRQQDVESEIDTLDRRVLLAVLLFILAGATIGYSMAERIADPVNRLTRATHRIAKGDLNARIAAASSDELGRLVGDFNAMADELLRQRGELERTHRLEAWAEMARQVAHEIKNPLTPIQLNAEHLRRVHADRGEPMGPVLQECVDTILHQVRLLRQIASEFSSFASSPTARPTHVDVAEMLREIIDPYRLALGDRIRFDVDVPAGLPPAFIDRTLTARALTNIVENALHAMPETGALSLRAGEEGPPSKPVIRITVTDTGRGMDAEALARAFEPYFSTKATGTGLGLPIARRNIELSGGRIQIASDKGRGTTVEFKLPVGVEAPTRTAFASGQEPESVGIGPAARNVPDAKSSK